VIKKIESQEGYNNIRALFTPARIYVAIHENVGFPYRLGCVDQSPLKVRWVSNVWGSSWSGASGVVRPPHRTALTVGLLHW
jgi:hypothetical protein